MHFISVKATFSCYIGIGCEIQTCFKLEPFAVFFRSVDEITRAEMVFIISRSSTAGRTKRFSLSSSMLSNHLLRKTLSWVHYLLIVDSDVSIATKQISRIYIILHDLLPWNALVSKWTLRRWWWWSDWFAVYLYMIQSYRVFFKESCQSLSIPHRHSHSSERDVQNERRLGDGDRNDRYVCYESKFVKSVLQV